MMEVRSATPRLAVTVVMTMLSLSCSPHESELSPAFKKRLEAMQKDAGQAVQENLAREVIPPGSEPVQSGFTLLKRGDPVWIQSGKSRTLQLSTNIARVSVADPELAGIVVLGPRTLMVNAKPLPPEQHQERQEEFGAGLQIGRTGTVLGRTLTHPPNLAETSLTIWGDDGVPDSHSIIIASFSQQQVLLEVTIAEVNRTAMEQHGVDFRVIQNDFIAASFLGAGIPPQVLSTVPPQTNQPLLPLTLGADTPTYAFIFPNEDFTAFVEALETEGLATVLAKPSILAMSGQTGTFQVGGEIPIRIATGFTAAVEFKPFGTIVNFIPHVSDNGDILLTVNPEVSAPDFTRQVEGIPTFVTRRTSTSAQLRNGQTLVVGGLLQTNTLEQERGVPYAKDIPYLGYIFRTTRYVKDITELVVVVTPKLVQPIAPGQDLPLPSDRGPLTRGEVRTKPEAAEVTRPRFPLLP